MEQPYHFCRRYSSAAKVAYIAAWKKIVIVPKGRSSSIIGIFGNRLYVYATIGNYLETIKHKYCPLQSRRMDTIVRIYPSRSGMCPTIATTLQPMTVELVSLGEIVEIMWHLQFGVLGTLLNSN